MKFKLTASDSHQKDSQKNKSDIEQLLKSAIVIEDHFTLILEV
jgi:hypothetical protein